MDPYFQLVVIEYNITSEIALSSSPDFKKYWNLRPITVSYLVTAPINVILINWYLGNTDNFYVSVLFKSGKIQTCS